MDAESKINCQDHNVPLNYYCSNCYKTMCSECRKSHSDFFSHFSFLKTENLSKDLPEILSNEVKHIESFLLKTSFQNNKDSKEVPFFITEDSNIIDKLMNNNKEFEKISNNLKSITETIKNDDTLLRNKIYQSYLDIKKEESGLESKVKDFLGEANKADLLEYFRNLSSTINILYKNCNLLVNFYHCIDLLNGSVNLLLDKEKKIVSFYQNVLEMKNNLDKQKISEIEKSSSKLNFIEVETNKEIEKKKEELESINKLVKSSFLKFEKYSYLNDLFDKSKPGDNALESMEGKFIDSMLYSQSLISPQLLISINLSKNTLASFELDYPIPSFSAIESVKNKAYISGGIIKGNPINCFFKFDPKYHSRNLIKLKDLTSKVSNHSMKHVKGYLYILGGKINNIITNNCSKYSISKDEMDTVANMNQQRYNFCACSFSDKNIYVFGGITIRKALKNQKPPVSRIERLNLNDDNRPWETIDIQFKDNNWKEIHSCGCIQRDETSILIFGGIYTEFQTKFVGKTLREIKHDSKDIYFFNPTDKTITKVDNWALKRNDYFTGNISYVEDGKSIYAFGSRKRNYIHILKLEENKSDIIKERLWEIYS